MSYTTDDFKYSINGGYSRGAQLPAKPVSVLYAYGQVDENGACCTECGGEWEGGFVVKLENGKIAHVTGWCDYTGWGCQDGASFELFDKIEDVAVKPFWDKDPSDLNQELPRVLKELAGEEAMGQSSLSRMHRQRVPVRVFVLPVYGELGLYDSDPTGQEMISYKPEEAEGEGMTDYKGLIERARSYVYPKQLDYDVIHTLASALESTLARLEAAEANLGVAVQCIEAYSWKGSSENRPARDCLDALRKVPSPALASYGILKGIAGLAERFEDLVRRHYLQKEVEYDLSYFDATHIALCNALDAWREAKSS